MHLGTHVSSIGSSRQPCSGQTVWGNPSPDQVAGVAWDWIEMHQGVVAMADPMALVTNLQLIDIHGDVLPRTQAALHLNEIVHALPWQHEVQRALHRAV